MADPHAARTVILGADTPLGITFVRLALARGDVVGAVHPAPARVPLLRDLGAEHPGRLHLLRDDPADPEAVAAARPDALRAIDRLVWAGFRDTVGAAVPGTPQNHRLDALDPVTLLESFRANAVQPLLAVRAWRPALRAGHAPRLLLVGTWLGSIALRHDGGQYGLAAPGAALHAIARALAHELDTDGITVLAGNPGSFKTALHGPAFQLTPEEAAGGLLAVVEGATPAGSGTLRDWKGRETPW
ncbi:MAG: SDR family NAD(P)-dependent oxidoreductase [Gemmatimonadales bacterium]|nr:SDR family NAD(P)-dependent oxidoreductase [Gemmatimonadales bacterium]